MTIIFVDICIRCCLVLNIFNNFCIMVYIFIIEISVCILFKIIYVVIIVVYCYNVILLIIFDINDKINFLLKKGVLFINVLNVKYKIF